MSKDFTYSINSIVFDENYEPSKSTRLTTNFANLARGKDREQNLRRTIQMINDNFNARANWDNENADRYSVELEIVHVDVDVEGNGETFPTIEILKTYVVDHTTQQRIEGMVGNNFSSYVRDYDFSVRLLEHNKNKEQFSVPDNYGDLHGKMFKDLIQSEAYQQSCKKSPVMCLSVSENKVYHRTTNEHPILGVEYTPNESSLTEQYFKKMGLKVRYFMPPNSVAPFAFYFLGDLLNDYTSIELISAISTMETFQKIYRPEIYNANSVAGKTFKPSLKHQNFSDTRIVYDRVERNRLAIEQGKLTEEKFVKPYQSILDKWAQSFAA